MKHLGVENCNFFVAYLHFSFHHVHILYNDEIAPIQVQLQTKHMIGRDRNMYVINRFPLL